MTSVDKSDQNVGEYVISQDEEIIWSVAKVNTSCRSRRVLQNEYLPTKSRLRYSRERTSSPKTYHVLRLIFSQDRDFAK